MNPVSYISFIGEQAVLYSRSCEYGIQAMLYLSLRGDERLALIREIAEHFGIPNPFLAKIVQQLVKAGLIRSFKGRRGGIKLSRNADEIRLIEIVSAIDTLGVFNRCILGFPSCSDTHWCPMHESWKEMRGSIQNYFETKSLADLAIESRRKLENMPEFAELLRNATAEGRGD